MEAPTVITNTTAQEAYVSTGLILQAALGVQTEIFYAYDNAGSALYDTATGQLTAAGVAYEETTQWLNGAVESSGYQVNGSVYTVQLIKNGQGELLVWNSAGQSTYAAASYTQYVDAQGLVHDIANGTVSIGTVPILLEAAFTGIQLGTLTVANGVALSITATVNNTGTIALDAAGNGADLSIVGAATLTGAGELTLSDNVGNVIGSNGVLATLTNVNDTISGPGTIGDSHLTLNNQGTINANDGLALVINTGSNTIANSGTLEATANGGLNIDSNVSNSNIIEALGTNAKVVLESVITDTAAGVILASGSGAQVDLDNATIAGGTLEASGNNAFIETVSGSTDALNGGAISSGSTVEINGNSTLALNGVVANSGILLVNGGALDINGSLTGGMTEISGAGKVTIAQSDSESVTFLAKSTGELVLDQATSYDGGNIRIWDDPIHRSH